MLKIPKKSTIYFLWTIKDESVSFFDFFVYYSPVLSLQRSVWCDKPGIAGVSDTLYVQPAQPAEDSAGGCTADLVLPILSYFVQEWDTEENIEE